MLYVYLMFRTKCIFYYTVIVHIYCKKHQVASMDSKSCTIFSFLKYYNVATDLRMVKLYLLKKIQIALGHWRRSPLKHL